MIKSSKAEKEKNSDRPRWTCIGPTSSFVQISMLRIISTRLLPPVGKTRDWCRQSKGGPQHAVIFGQFCLEGQSEKELSCISLEFYFEFLVQSSSKKQHPLLFLCCPTLHHPKDLWGNNWAAHEQDLQGCESCDSVFHYSVSK